MCPNCLCYRKWEPKLNILGVKLIRIRHSQVPKNDRKICPKKDDSESPWVNIFLNQNQFLNSNKYLRNRSIFARCYNCSLFQWFSTWRISRIRKDYHFHQLPRSEKINRLGAVKCEEHLYSMQSENCEILLPCTVKYYYNVSIFFLVKSPFDFMQIQTKIFQESLNL